MRSRRTDRRRAAPWLWLAIALGTASLARAEGTVQSEVDSRRVGVQDVIQLNITVEASSLPDQVPTPALINLRIVGGPSVSTQMSWVNGRSSQSRSWTYALQPLAVGRAEVGAVSVRLGSDQASAPAIPIEVVSGRLQPAPQPQSQRPNDPFEAMDRDLFGDLFGRNRAPAPKLFVEAKANRASLYVGEPLLLTYYLYTQTTVSGLQFATAPQYAGFWAEDIERSGEPKGEQVVVDGSRYVRFPVMMKLLYPTRSGRLSIPAATLSIEVARQSMFDAGGVVQRPTQSISVNVKPIPDEPGFSGAVGRFHASAALDRPSLAFGEAATLRFKVEGSGNLKWIDRGPALSVPGAKVYPPQAKSDLKVLPSGIAGSRTWEFVIVPQTTGTFEIPPLEFTYFDPAVGRVQRTSTAPIALKVQGETMAAAPAPPPAASGMAARGNALPLRADLDQGSSLARAVPGRVLGLVVLGVLLIHGLLWGGSRFGRGAWNAPARAGRPRGGVRGALADLQRVGRDRMNKEKAAALIEKSVHGVFGSLEGDASERGRAVRALLDEVHAVRYAPQLGDYSERLRELATRAGEVVRRWA